MNYNIPIFNFNSHVIGGTEYQAKTFHEKVLPDSPNFQKYMCMIAPGKNLANEHVNTWDGEILFWAHNLPSQFGPEMTEFFWSGNHITDKIKYVIVPSEYAKDKFHQETKFPKEKLYVIPNGIEPLKYNPDKFKNVKRVKITHTSGPNRGMMVLLNSLKHLDQDFQLDIFNDFFPEMYLDNEFMHDDRITFYGKTPRKTMYRYMESSHLHAYPPIFLETFCIAIAEAMSAGLLPVYSNVGSLPEVVNGHGLYLDNVDDTFVKDGMFQGDEYAKAYAEILSEGIDTILSGKWDPTEQIEYINGTYGWDKVLRKWKDFHDLL
jgi:glycosyltransferase involved in cell wall biosynthesis